MKKVRWADMTDDDLEPPPAVSKHGIKVKKNPPPRPPSPPADKIISDKTSKNEV
jgi:hypothetical protein